MYDIFRLIDEVTAEIEKTDYYYDKDGILKKKEYEQINTIYNVSQNGKDIELIYYPENFKIPKIQEVDDDSFLNNTNYIINEVKSNRNFKRNEEGYWCAKKGLKTEEFAKSMDKSIRRAKHNFYDYALNNNWEYFTTFTFRNKEDRFDREKVKNLWKYFNRDLRKINEDYKAIAVMEPHEGWSEERERKEVRKLINSNTDSAEIDKIIEYKKDNAGGFHLHALISDINLPLTPARDPITHLFKFSSLGNQLFNCDIWNHGFSSIACLEPNCSSRKIANYCMKYLTAEFQIFYNEKRYYKTRNLKARETTFYNYTLEQCKVIVLNEQLKYHRMDKYGVHYWTST